MLCLPVENNSARFCQGVDNPVEKVLGMVRINIFLLITRILNILEGKESFSVNSDYTSEGVCGF